MKVQATPRRSRPQASQTLFDDGEAMLALVTASFKQAARDAVAENDRLGIVTHGTELGDASRIVERKPVRGHRAAEKISSGQ